EEDVAKSGSNLLDLANLTGIALAHRVDLVRVVNPQLHEVDLAVVLENATAVEPVPAESGDVEDLRPINSLVTQVVQRVDRSCPAEDRIFPVIGFQVGGAQGGLMIVAVEDVHGILQGAQSLEGGPGEEDEPLAGVGVLFLRLGVNVDSI